MFGGSFPEPREFQSQAIEDLRQGIREGHQNQLVCAPTGSGKTYIGMKVVSDTLAKYRRALFLCDRRTLLAQTSDVAESYGLWDHSVIAPGSKRLDLHKLFQIASTQTLASRGWVDADVIVVDEAHTRYKTWVDRITSKDCHAKVIGLSATPFTKGLGKIFTRCVNAATMACLVGQGILVPLRVFSCRRPDMRGAETRGGEWTDAAAEKAEVKLVGDVVTEWHRHAYGLKTIGFGATVAHCEEMRRQFQASGVGAELYVGETKEDERVVLMDAFRPHDGELRILLTVEALAKGFDMRDVECVIDARPLQKSLSTAIQMWGRGLRSSPETGKTECLLLDFSGNIIRFADDFADFYYNGVSALDTHAERLDREVRKDEEKEAKACPECGFKPVGRKCIQCGWEKPRKSLVESAPGVMEEIVIAGKSAAKDCAHLWAQLATYALSTARPGKDPRKRAICLYKDFTGRWPPHAWGLDVPACAPTPATRNKIRALAIAFAHRREASHA